MGRIRDIWRSYGVASTVRNIDDAKQDAVERHTSVAARANILRRANGWMLMKIIISIISVAHAMPSYSMSYFYFIAEKARDRTLPRWSVARLTAA
jgi:hypothetical protein